MEMVREAGKFGKTTATIDHHDLTMLEFIKKGAVLKSAPIGFGHYKYLDPHGWGMLGNDRYGDCVIAGGDHEIMMLNAMNGINVRFNAKATLSDYAALTGFDPITGANDNGTNMRAALNYRRRIGLIDADGKRHLIGGYCSLEAGNFAEHLQALRIFDCVAIGFEVTESAMEQFSYDKPWTYVRDNNIIGGHYIPIVGRPTAESLDTITWACIQRMSKSFFYHYNDESYGFFTEESLKNGKTPEGFDITGLRNAITKFN